MPALERRHLLILGGTAEARLLAVAATSQFGERLRVTTSLAGRTRGNAALPGELRRGGFGGAGGLADYIGAARIDFVIDATHPFATRISAAAQEACRSRAVPLLALTRPGWAPRPADRWIMVADAAEAAASLPPLGRRAFLTIGQSGLAAFAGMEGVHFLVRLVDPPVTPLPLASYEVVLGRGPFACEAERSIMMRHAVDVVVAKESGGAATAAKLEAARLLAIPVIMLRRPRCDLGENVERVSDAIAWLDRRIPISEEALS